MIRPASFVRLTSIYIFLSLILIDLSLLFKLLGKAYTELLIFIAFPLLIMGTLFQIYPTLQGIAIRWEWLTYIHLALFLTNLFSFFVKPASSPYFYFLFALLSLSFLLINTKSLRDPSVVFFLLGGVYFALSGFFMLMDLNLLMIKHTLTAGFFLNVILGAYYVFVPMLQVEELKHPKARWISLILHNLSIPPFLYGWHVGNMKLVAYSGLFVLLSFFLLAFVVYQSLLQKKSPLKGLDPSVRYLILGLFMAVFFLSIGISTAGSGNYGFIGWHRDGMLYGFLLFITIGASYHIVPFLYWWRVYAPKIGKEKIPTLKELINPEVLKFYLFAGLPSFVLALLNENFNPTLSSIFYALFLLVNIYYSLRTLPLAFFPPPKT